MNILISQFGDILTSRPAGREAALVFMAYNKFENNLTLDFSGVKVMTPSWLSEFVQTLKERNKFNITYLESKNPTVVSSIDIIESEIN